ncbi:MAG: aspartate aminotransferase family protein [Desulfobacterales bacterium]|nr:MAG: aspartate aminotransferase family protein [Desulfobacterales bacterium]
MMDKQAIFEKWINRKDEEFKKETKESARLFAKAQENLPGGNTRTVTYFSPYPLYMAKGKGCKLYDVDGNEYIDFLNQYTALIHGHCHPAIVEAVNEEANKGLSFAAPTEKEAILGRMICERIKSVEQVRFCNSGTEATLFAIRAARLNSGKSRIVKIEGAYHGSHDLAEVSVLPVLKEAGPNDRPVSVPEHRAVPKSILDEVIAVPFNNKEATEKIIREHQKEIACVIMEVMVAISGCIPAEDGYLDFVRDLTRELGIILIYDEIVTFRLGQGGGQGIYDIQPDLTTFGKVIGGGLPVGAFGGSRELMKVFSPLEEGSVTHSGTFNANPMTLAAGIACLKELTPAAMERINSLGELIRQGINSILEKNGVVGMAIGLGSLAHVHFNKERVRDYRTYAQGNFQAITLLHRELLERGINIAPRGGEIAISTPMTEKEIKMFLTAFEESLIEIKPFIKQTTPELII